MGKLIAALYFLMLVASPALAQVVPTKPPVLAPKEQVEKDQKRVKQCHGEAQAKGKGPGNPAYDRHMTDCMKG